MSSNITENKKKTDNTTYIDEVLGKVNNAIAQAKQNGKYEFEFSLRGENNGDIIGKQLKKDGYVVKKLLGCFNYGYPSLTVSWNNKDTGNTTSKHKYSYY